MKLTIEKFQKLQSISDIDEDELDKASRLVQVLLDKSSDEVDKMSLKRFGKLCRQLEKAFDLNINKVAKSMPSKYIWANGKRYMLNLYTKQPFNTGRYIEVVTFSKSDPIGNMHNILASICSPMKWSWLKFRFVDEGFNVLDHEKYSDDMKQADFKHGYNAMVFFYLVLARSTGNTMGFLEMKQQMRKQHKKRLNQLKNISETILDGSITQSKSVS